ncbi:hypothetical protein M408DRAFT_94192 [Serendipita vermifera MAFF 305830]|uniref:F-box domain-containing protein n=1 Tax=Serendipita vermifera MAFF 305830 TaxID=933852 RepID=A0A0C2X8D9_SERVB|nr:hypothetical protein M408DRAFT_94192 [Serendipita vermifera MAFF 305830]
MPVLFKEIVLPTGKSQSSSDGAIHRPSALSPKGRNVLLSDDIVYATLTVVANSTTSDLDRRDALFAACHVCQVWSRAAQSLLFRHVFLQIRSSMMVLLKIIDRETERGRRLAGYIQSATIKLSKYAEELDPPGLPMIHVRHLPALLCHMPNLCTLDLTLGAGSLTPAIISAFARGPCIIDFRIEGGSDTRFLTHEMNPWPHLQSITTKNVGTAHIHENCSAPRVRLSQVTIHYTYGGSIAELPWLIGHSKETLSHVSLISERDYRSYGVLDQPQLRNIQSLTLGRIIWDEQISNILHTFTCLKELRFASFIQLAHSFPSNLPDTIEHLLVTSPFSPSIDQKPIYLDMTRPALLRTLTVIDASSTGDVLFRTWFKDYIPACEIYGISIEITRPSRSISDEWLRHTILPIQIPASKVPVKIRQSDGRFQPTASQLDLTDFEVIIGAKNPAKKIKPPSGPITSSWTPIPDNFRTAHWNIRGKHAHV